MSVAVTDLAPEVAAAATAFGLLRDEGGEPALDLGFFAAPADHVGRALSEPAQRDALLRAIDGLLPPGTPATLNGSARRYHPLVGDAQAGRLLLTVERGGDPAAPSVVLGLAGELQAPGGGAALTADVPVVSAVAGTVTPVVASAAAPAKLDVRVPFGGEGGSLGASLRLVAPPDEEQTRIVLRLVPVGDDGVPLPAIELDPLAPPTGTAQLVALLVQAAFAALATAGGTPAELRRLARNLPGLLGFGAGLPPLPFAELGDDPGALRGWLRALCDTPVGGRPALLAWLDHLAQLVGPGSVPAARTVLPTEADPVVVPLVAAAPNVPAVDMTVAVRGGPADRTLAVGLRVDARPGGAAAVAADAVLVALPLQGTAPAVLGERLDVLVRTPVGGGPLVSTPAITVGSARGGLRLRGDVVVPVLELRDVTLAPDLHLPVLDLTDADALSAAAQEALGDALTAGLGDEAAGIAGALRTLIGLGTTPAIDLRRLVTAPTRALADHVRALAATPDRWKPVLEALWTLLGGAGDAPAVAGAGTAADPWRLPLTHFDAPAGALPTLALALWDAAPAGADTPRLRLGLRLAAEGALAPPLLAWEAAASSTLLGFDLPPGGGGAVRWLGAQTLRASLSALPEPGADVPVGVGAERIGVEARWEPGAALAVAATIEDLTVHGGDETAPLGTLVLDGGFGVDPGAPDLGLGVDPDLLWGALRLLAARAAHTWLGPTGDAVAALLGLARPAGLGLEPDAPLLGLPVPGDLRSLVGDPLGGLRRWLATMVDGEGGLGAAGVPFLALLGRLGGQDDPSSIPLASFAGGHVEALGWLGPDGPPLAWAAPVLERLAADDLDAAGLVTALQELRPYLGDRVRGAADPAVVAGALRELADAVASGDGVVPLRAALPQAPGWDVAGATAVEAHPFLPQSGVAIRETAARVAALTAGVPAAQWAVVLTAPDLAGDDCWTPLLRRLGAAAPVTVDLRPGPDPLAVDLSGVGAASHYVVRLDDDGARTLPQMAAQLARVAARIRTVKPGARLLYVGHSTAGLVAAQCVADQPAQALGLVTIGAPLAPVDVPGFGPDAVAEGVRIAQAIAPFGVAPPALDGALRHLAQALDGHPAGAFRRAGAAPPALGGVPALAIAGALDGDLIPALADAAAAQVGLAGGGAVQHAGGALRVPAPLPAQRDDEPEIRAALRLDLGRARIAADAPAAPAAPRLVFELALGGDDGWLVGGPGGTDPHPTRVRRAELEVALTLRDGKPVVDVDARLLDAALLGAGRPVVRLRDPQGPALLGEVVVALAEAAAPGGRAAAIVTLLADLGLLVQGEAGPEVAEEAFAALLEEPGAYLGGRLPALLDRTGGLLGLVRDDGALPGEGPWRLALAPAAPLEVVVERAPWRIGLRTADAGFGPGGPGGLGGAGGPVAVRLGATLDLQAGTLRTDAALDVGALTVEREAATGRVVLRGGWLAKPVVLAPADPATLLPQLGSAAVRLAADAAAGALLEPWTGPLGSLSGLLADPAGWVTGPAGLGDGTLPEPARVNRLLARLAQALGLTSTGDAPAVLPGGLVLRSVPVLDDLGGQRAVRLALETLAPVVLGTADGGDVTLALTAAAQLDGTRQVTPGGELTLHLPLPGEWGAIDLRAGLGPRGVELSVTPTALGTTVELLPTVSGLSALVEGSFDRVLPQALDELVAGLRAGGATAGLDRALAVATALDVYAPAAAPRGFRDRADALAGLVDRIATGGIAAVAAPVAAAARALLDDVLWDGAVVAPPSPTAIAVRLPVAGGRVDLVADLGTAPTPTLHLAAAELQVSPFARVEAAVGLGPTGLSATAGVQATLDTGTGLVLRPRIDAAASAEGVRVTLRPLSDDRVVVRLAPDPAAPGPEGLALLAEHWLVPLATGLLVDAAADVLDAQIPGTQDVTARAVLVEARVIDDAGKLATVPLPPPAKLLGDVLGALDDVTVALPGGLTLGVAHEGARYGLRLGGTLPIPVGDQQVDVHLGLPAELGAPWGAEGQGLAVLLLDTTDATSPRADGVVRLGGLGVGMSRRDGRPLIDAGAFRLGAASAHVQADVDLFGPDTPRVLGDVRTAVALDDLAFGLGDSGDPLLVADALIAFRNADFDDEVSQLRRDEGPGARTDLPVKELRIDSQALAVVWDEPRINHWLEQLAPDLADADAPETHELSLRVLYGGASKEVRFDWEITGPPGHTRRFKLPGAEVALPEGVRVTLMLGGEGRGLDDLALALTYDSDGAGLKARSTFAWDRDGTRELSQNADASPPPNQKPLFELTADVKKPGANAPARTATLVLLSWDLGDLGLPTFMRQLAEPLTDLAFDTAAARHAPTKFSVGRLDENTWDVHLEINADEAFQLPFLRSDTPGAEQLVEVYRPASQAIAFDFSKELITIPIGVRVLLGDVKLATETVVPFNWGRLALEWPHEAGLHLESEHPQLPAPGDGANEHLGLHWTMKGTKVGGRYRYFSFKTKDSDYRIEQAEGAEFLVEYTELSEEAIGFAVRDFAISAGGLDVTAEVIDRPAKLNGIDTKFRFAGTTLEIVESRVKAFTLHGTGPLPPDLVGEATADIALQFAQEGGALTLKEGQAEVKGNKLLDCKGTRFRFSVDKLGLRFVHDGGFHLYFLITGSAEFVLAEGDDADGPLALLGGVKIDLVDAPLTGDMSVLARHVEFRVTLPKPKSFSFLGAFEMEIRAIGFVPQAQVFDGDGAMILTGQLKFAQGIGDAPDARSDVHTLYIGLPKKGSFLPRIHFKELPVNLNLGEAFRLNGSVEFVDTAREKGFLGDGVLEIQGLPSIAASFAFLRVRRDEGSPWVRAWFIYLEARKVSFPIPVVQLYLREVGLGFGYRYTLAGIAAADRTSDVRQLLQELKQISKTQGDLSKRDRWVVDLEEPGQDPRWTVALRAMISQSTASPSPLRYETALEKDAANTFLLDAVVALRSDLTFLMAVRAWLSANYHDYVTDANGIRERPLFTGFVLLSPRQKRLLANLSSNPDGKLGKHPQLPEFVEKAVQGVRFSATLLIEPGLLHMELGWPNMLRWSTKLGPLDVEMRGGFIFRISRTEMVVGISYLARAKLELKAGVDLGIVGVRVQASASLAYGARFVGVLAFDDPGKRSALYGALGLDVQIRVSIELWLKLKLAFVTIKKTFRLSVKLSFTAGVEAGMTGASLSQIGMRGTGTLALSAMGRSFRLSVKLGVNEGAVRSALERTKPFLNVGLEATEVESVPGVGGGAGARLGAGAGAGARELETLEVVDPDGTVVHAAARRTEAAAIAAGFTAPDYDAFVVRAEADTAWSYVVLLPEEEGFLPPPPSAPATVESDFVLDVKKGAGEEYALEHFDPVTQTWQPATFTAAGTASIAWKAAWGRPIVTDAERHDPESGAAAAEPALTLGDYLRHAFLTEGEDLHPVGDPARLVESGEVVTDPRVHDPDESAFEAAVRGAVEQFRASPLFKHDPSLEYDRLLELAFDDRTSVYAPNGKVESEAELREAQRHQQALELRDMIVQDLVADVREYAAASAAAGASGSPAPPADSVAFHAGLVLRVKGTKAKQPKWLNEAVADTAAPAIRQRATPEATTPPSSGAAHPVRTFNLVATDFAERPPRFERVQQLTDATTIALAWDLVWDQDRAALHKDEQADPDHHLMHYHVRRRPLDGGEQEAVYTVKDAAALHRDAHDTATPGRIRRLQPRFRVVDHFTDETAADTAALPAGGRSYLYTITPVDFTGHTGRPLTLVATRFPNDPPQVPADGELTVRHELARADLDPVAPGAPTIVAPKSVRVTWTDPAAPAEGPAIGIERYVLVLRRSSTMPIGSYGVDANVQGPRAKRLPTTNARTLPTDVRIVLAPQAVTGGTPDDKAADVPLQALRDAGVLPAGEPARWRPESWRAFLQTESLNGVPSALAPVQLLIEAAPATAPAPGEDPEQRREQRRPAELEWLARPQRQTVLPPEDGRATPGPAHVPMPGREHARFTGALDGIAYAAHPAGLRCVRLRWNQGPSADPAYPLDLSAGFEVLELDVDAHTTATFADADALRDALRPVQDVRMVPADDLLLTPGDTLATSQWEAWYPSFAQRGGAKKPWHSWRESSLRWPAWPGVTDEGLPRTTALHPFLEALVAQLDDVVVDVQGSPPLQPGDLAAFLRSTAPGTDPYGWGVLQRLGLSTALTLREPGTGEPITGAPLLAAIQGALAALRQDEQHAATMEHLHVELLVRPDRATSLEESAVGADALLALVQLSLRPIPEQRRFYRALDLTGPPGARVDLLLHLAGDARRCTLVDRVSGAVVEIEPPEDGASAQVRRSVQLGIDGRATLLLRSRSRDAADVRVGVALSAPPLLKDSDPQPAPAHVELRKGPNELRLVRSLSQLTGDARTTVAAQLAEADRWLLGLDVTVPQPFGLQDERAARFPVPPELATETATWQTLKRHLEGLNSTDPDLPADQRIVLPESPAELAAVLPDLLGWTQRFFDACGAVVFDGDRAEAGAGPWQATAYPRVGTPAYVAPDAGGRLTYDHLLEDQWAHAYRYHVRPYGRYDLLWQSLRNSPALFPDARALVPPGPATDAGGLDVVLERTRTVDAPLVLSSTRLDPRTPDGTPGDPGPTWEVIVAQHPEQALRERNVTLARQLAFRQTVFTLMRRFAYPGWPAALEAMTGAPVTVDHVEERYPELPGAFPATPDGVALDGPVDERTARTLDLPERLPRFGQGALVLQWDGLPFFYEHRLVLAAQADSTVSNANEVVQRDFEYRAPTPAATAAGEEMAWRPPGGGAPITVHARRMRVELAPLWDALPAAAQATWADERPDDAASAKAARRPASLPDPEVVYQLVEVYSGNVEVQCELLFDAGAGTYVVRQLGKRLLADVQRVLPPPAAAPQRPFALDVAVQQVAEEPLAGALDVAALPSPTKEKVRVEGGLLRVAGPLTAADLAALRARLGEADRAAVQRMYDAWRVAEPISAPPAAGVSLPAQAGLEPADELHLVWTGAMSDADRAALAALPGDRAFHDALDRLAAAASAPDAAPGGVVRATAAPGPDQLPAALAAHVRFERDADGTYVALHAEAAADLVALRAWARLPELADAVTALEQARAAQPSGRLTVPLRLPGRPRTDQLPPGLRARLLIGRTLLRYHGLMTAPEARALRAALTAPVDQPVAQRLYAASLAQGMRGRELRIRALRRSATPSVPMPIEAAEL